MSKNLNYLLRFILIVLILTEVLYIIDYIKLNRIQEIMIVFFTLIILLTLKKYYENFRASLNLKFGEYGDINFKSKNHYEKKKLIPSYYYDLNTDATSEDCNWLRPPCNTPLLKNVYINEPTGEDEILKDNPYEDENHPPLDGKSKIHKKMFMFTKNKCSLSCCPSTYTCDRGCVCLNQDQRDFINSRGKNRIPTSKHNLNF